MVVRVGATAPRARRYRASEVLHLADDLETLYEVQQLDTRIQEQEREREALESGAELRAHVEVLRMETQAARDQLRAVENELRDTELQIKTHEAKQRDFEGKMYSGRVRNPKELDDMQREVEMLGGLVDKLEDQGLNLMEEVERRRAALMQQEADLEQRTAELATVEKTFAAASARIAAEIERLAAQRAQLTPRLPAALLRRYDDLRAKRSNLAIVKLNSDVCSGCRISIPLDIMRQVKRGDRAVACESCGRILYWDNAGQTQPRPHSAAPISGDHDDLT